MAHKITGTKNQDEAADPQLNENPDSTKKEEISSGAVSQPQLAKNRKQENLQNRGFQEDQPNNPVRSTGSLARDQQENKYRQPGDEFNEDTDKISS
ncbi:MAG: hypothetical protein H7122_03475 [Chitinophagaceae bacterium]|nr:hypothetical protein [Chitinophagaceae bacterium]